MVEPAGAGLPGTERGGGCAPAGATRLTTPARRPTIPTSGPTSPTRTGMLNDPDGRMSSTSRNRGRTPDPGVPGPAERAILRNEHKNAIALRFSERNLSSLVLRASRHATPAEVPGDGNRSKSKQSDVGC